MISHFNNNKATGINSIPLKILKLAKEPSAGKLLSIYNLPFTTGIFPGSLKLKSLNQSTKKPQNLNVQTIGPSPCSPTLIKCYRN